MNRFSRTGFFPGLALMLLTGCSKQNSDTPIPGITLTPVATALVQWTGVTVSQQGTVFACFPRMEVDTISYSVAAVSNTQSTPFPNQAWSTWHRSLTPQDHFICVQSVCVDDQNNL